MMNEQDHLFCEYLPLIGQLCHHTRLLIGQCPQYCLSLVNALKCCLLIGQYSVTGGRCQGDRLQGEMDCGPRVLQGVGGEDDNPGKFSLLIGQYS